MIEPGKYAVSYIDQDLPDCNILAIIRIDESCGWKFLLQQIQPNNWKLELFGNDRAGLNALREDFGIYIKWEKIND